MISRKVIRNGPDLQVHLVSNYGYQRDWSSRAKPCFSKYRVAASDEIDPGSDDSEFVYKRTPASVKGASADHHASFEPKGWIKKSCVVSSPSGPVSPSKERNRHSAPLSASRAQSGASPFLSGSSQRYPERELKHGNLGDQGVRTQARHTPMEVGKIVMSSHVPDLYQAFLLKLEIMLYLVLLITLSDLGLKIRSSDCHSHHLTRLGSAHQIRLFSVLR